MEKQKSSAALAAERLASAKTIYVNNKILGLVTNFSFQINASSVRVLKAGERTTIPYVGQYSVLVSLRGLIITKEVLPKLEDKIDTLEVNNLRFKKCRVTSANLSAQAGQILMYEEVSLECEDMLESR